MDMSATNLRGQDNVTSRGKASALLPKRFNGVKRMKTIFINPLGMQERLSDGAGTNCYVRTNRLEGDNEYRLVGVSEWISVEDRLPENNCCCMSFHIDWGMGIAEYKPGFGFSADQILVPYVAPTHWMPLPEFPQ